MLSTEIHKKVYNFSWSKKNISWRAVMGSKHVYFLVRRRGLAHGVPSSPLELTHGCRSVLCHWDVWPFFHRSVFSMLYLHSEVLVLLEFSCTRFVTVRKPKTLALRWWKEVSVVQKRWNRIYVQSTFWGAAQRWWCWNNSQAAQTKHLIIKLCAGYFFPVSNSPAEVLLARSTSTAIDSKSDSWSSDCGSPQFCLLCFCCMLSGRPLPLLSSLTDVASLQLSTGALVHVPIRVDAEPPCMPPPAAAMHLSDCSVPPVTDSHCFWWETMATGCHKSSRVTRAWLLCSVILNHIWERAQQRLTHMAQQCPGVGDEDAVLPSSAAEGNSTLPCAAVFSLLSCPERGSALGRSRGKSSCCEPRWQLN